MKCSNTHMINWYDHVIYQSEAAELREYEMMLLKNQLQHHLGVNSLQVWNSVL